jgi:hypothetical protein
MNDEATKSKKVEQTPALTPATVQNKVQRSSEMWNTQLALANELVKSQLCPLKKAEDVVIVLAAGQELGIGATVALNGIHVIEGRFSLGVHIIVGLLLKNSITFTLNAEEDYAYIKVRNEDGSEGVAFLPGTKVHDRKTTIKFNRMVKRPDGSWKEMEISFSVRLSEMQQQGLLTKNNWIKQPRTMLRTRALSMGARLIAADILGGMHEYSEILDAKGIEYQMKEDETGFTEVTIVGSPSSTAEPIVENSIAVEEPLSN